MISIFTLIIEFLILNIFKAPENMENPSDAVVIIFIIIFSVAFIFEIEKSSEMDYLGRPLIVGYLCRLFFLFFDLYGRGIMSLPNSGADSEVFYNQGLVYSQEMSDSSSPIVKVVGVMFRYLGTSRLYVQFLLMLFSIVSLYMVARILIFLEVDFDKSQKAMFILCLLPNLAILSSVFLRESVVTMFASISLLFFVKWFRGYSVINLFLAIIAILGGALFHSGIIGMMLGYVLVVVLMNRNEQRIKINISGIILAGVLSLVLVYLFNNYSDIFFQKMSGMNSLEQVANVNSAGDSSYASYVGNSNSVLNIVKYTPVRIIMFQFSPFIWQLRGISDIIAMVLDSFFFIYVYYRTIKYCRIKNAKNQAIVIALFIVGLATTFVFAWGVTNTGTALRHRNKITFLYAVLLALTYEPVDTNDESEINYVQIKIQ